MDLHPEEIHLEASKGGQEVVLRFPTWLVISLVIGLGFAVSVIWLSNHDLANNLNSLDRTVQKLGSVVESLSKEASQPSDWVMKEMQALEAESRLEDRRLQLQIDRLEGHDVSRGYAPEVDH